MNDQGKYFTQMKLNIIKLNYNHDKKCNHIIKYHKATLAMAEG